MSRKQRRTFHQPRLRRQCYGDLIQIDGSDHRWFEDRADPCTLLVFIDDATSTLMELEVNDLSLGLVGKYIDVYELADGRIQVRARGVALPHSILNPERRITHAAITENKRLGAVLAYIKEEQEKPAPQPNVKPISAKNGYKKTGRRPPGPPSKMEAYYERRRAERAAAAAAAANKS